MSKKRRLMAPTTGEKRSDSRSGRRSLHKRSISETFRSQETSSAAPWIYQHTASTAMSSTSLPPAAVPKAMPVHISRPLEPTPLLQSLPVAEYFCPSGFDMLEILMKVATRPSPKMDIGPVDLSCAMCVCDLAQQDMPIVYCSEAFERLTGYTEKEVIGRNCRFLQYPSGRVAAEGCSDDGESLHDLKTVIDRRLEGRGSITNYRKDGTCFTNLLTLIPIAWDTPELRYYVGFQADARRLPS